MVSYHCLDAVAHGGNPQDRAASLQRSYQTIESELQSSDISLLPISFIDTLQIYNLPLHHRDPFDTMLIAQAMNRALVLISRDNKFDAYPIQRLWVS